MHPPHIKTFFKGPFTSFLGLTSLHLVNIQPNSKLHSPTKIFRICSRVRDQGFFLEPSPPPFEFAGCAPA